MVSFFQLSPPKLHTHFSCTPHCHVPLPFLHPWFDHLSNIGWAVQIVKFLTIKFSFWQIPTRFVVKKLYNVLYTVSTQQYISTMILYIHSGHIMATCFDRKTVIFTPIENIFKVQRSEHSIEPHFVYSKI